MFLSFIYELKHFKIMKSKTKIFSCHLLIITFLKYASLQLINLNRDVLEQKLGSGINNSSIDLSKSLIGYISPYTFDGLASLIQLDLNTNNLTTLEGSVFEGLINLEELELSRNKIASIETEAFSGLSSLIALDLNSNYLIGLEANVFDKVNKIEYLYVRYNGLIDIDPNAFSGLSDLIELDLSSNNFISRIGE